MLYHTQRSSYVAVEQRVICSSTPTNEGAFHFLRARTKRWQVRTGLLNCKGKGKVPFHPLVIATLSAKKVTLILPAT